MRSGCNNVIWGRKTVEWSFRGPQSPRTQPSASVILQNACCEKAALRQAAWKVLPLRVYVPFWSDSSSASEAMQDTEHLVPETTLLGPGEKVPREVREMYSSPRQLQSAEPLRSEKRKTEITANLERIAAQDMN